MESADDRSCAGCQPALPATYSWSMVMSCADCGCLVERGVRVTSCDRPTCCCSELPTREALDEMATEIRGAFESLDIARFGALLADDVRWGDDTAPNKCRTSAEVVATFERLLADGVRGEVADLKTGSAGILCRLVLRWPDEPVHLGRDEIFHLYRVRGRRISEIEPYDSASEAEAALSLS